MENHQKFTRYVDPQKVNHTAQQLLSTMSEVQGIFLYLQTHTDLSIIRCLSVAEQHLQEKEGKNLLHLLKPISDEFPELKILPIYLSAVNHFNRHFPAAALRDYIKAKAAVLEQQDYSQPENRIFLKVKAIDWEKIFAFLEDHYFLLSLWNFIKANHPQITTLTKDFRADILNSLHNYFGAKEILALNNLIGKSPENKGIKVPMTSRTKEGFIKVMQEPMVDSFDLLKDLALNDTCSIEELESILPEVKAALEKIDLNKQSPSKIMLQKLLEFIQVEKEDESIQFLILHDLLQLLYPYRFTSDSTFLEEGPIFNERGSMDGEVRRKKIREVKMIMDIPINR